MNLQECMDRHPAGKQPKVDMVKKTSPMVQILMEQGGQEAVNRLPGVRLVMRYPTSHPLGKLNARVELACDRPSNPGWTPLVVR